MAEKIISQVLVFSKFFDKYRDGDSFLVVPVPVPVLYSLS